MRICFIGDSFVAGTGDDTCLGWTGRVCAAARQAGRDVTGYNLGIRRDTSADILGRWLPEAKLRLPDDQDGRLVFSFGVNDCVPGEDDGVRIRPARSLANAETILRAAQAWLPVLMIGPLPVMDDGETNRRAASLSEDFALLSARLGIPYLAVLETMRGSAAWARETGRGDGVHPNSGGYAELAAFIAKWEAWRAWIAGSSGEGGGRAVPASSQSRKQAR